MISACVWCFIKPFDEYNYASKIYGIKCMHLNGNVNIEFHLSFRRILFQVIMSACYVFKIIHSSLKLKNSSDNPSRNWVEVGFILGTLQSLMVLMSLSLTHKWQIKLDRRINSLLESGKVLNITSMWKRDSKMTKFYNKLITCFLLFNPLSIMCCLDYVFINRDCVLYQICNIWCIYILSCMGITIYMTFKAYTTFWQNMVKALKVILKQNYFSKNARNFDFEKKLTLIQTTITTLHKHYKTLEIILTPPLLITMIMLPVTVMVTIVSVIEGIKVYNVENKTNLTDFNMLMTAIYGIFMTTYIIIVAENSNEPVSFESCDFVNVSIVIKYFSLR